MLDHEFLILSLLSLFSDVSSQTKHQTHAKAHGNLTLDKEKAHGWD